MPYIHFTQERKDRAARTDLEVFLRNRGEKLLPSGRDKRLASDHIYPVPAGQGSLPCLHQSQHIVFVKIAGKGLCNAAEAVSLDPQLLVIGHDPRFLRHGHHLLATAIVPPPRGDGL